MAFLHFVNCMALAFTPYLILYKHSGLSEYTSIWKCGRAALGFFLSQLVKLLVLATFFPAFDSEGFSVLPELLKSSADVIDVVGMHILIAYIMTGKSEVRFLSVGLGWSAAFSAASRLFLFWNGARATAFHWRYMQSALDSSSDLILYLSMACLVWLAPRIDIPSLARRFTYILLIGCVYHNFVYQAINSHLHITGWSLVAAKAAYTAAMAGGTLLVYSSLPYHAQYYKRE